jgi:hypothetical protein
MYRPVTAHLGQTMRRIGAALLVVVIALCPLASACLSHSLAHGGLGQASAADAAHDHSHHGDQSNPLDATVPDGCNAIQHCAPFAGSGDLQSTIAEFDFHGVRFPSSAASIAVGMDYDPDVPPPRPLS